MRILTDPLSRNRRRPAPGSALIIVLFFVVLLSVVTFAFLSRALVAVQVSNGSTGETRSKILASSASDIIIGDLKQEIIAGSASVGTAASWPVYTPTSNQCMIPWQTGVPLLGSPTTNATPNLVSRSVSPSNLSGTAPYVAYPSTLYTSTTIPPNRAATDSSAASPTLSTNAPYTTSKVNSSYPSLNGRYVSPAQWNSHYLVPRNSAVVSLGSTNTDSTPTPNFVTPDWIVVTRGGATNVTWVSGTGGLTDATMTNNNYAVGRYAYAVYNEGGLLDMNAAGYPGTDAGSSSVGLTSTQISKKGSLALADLTQLSAGAVNLTQAQINNIVGWRNYASAELGSANGSYGGFSFSSATSSNWLTNFVMGNTNGFMQIVSPPSGVTTPPTDQAFLSRQQLIGVTKSLGISPDFLQYMGTFTRALEQPSFAPNASRPVICGSSAPPAIGSEDAYQGNNDGYGGDNAINPSFLTIRVVSGASWYRFNGIQVVGGEPLVKTKFPLSYLSMVAYNATTASAKTSFPATTRDPDPIYDHFGLTRTGTSLPWTYSHGITDSNNNVIIGTLTQVAAAGREPDFAELLKAALCAGSLAKGGPNLNVPGVTTNYQYTIDTAVDYQVLQIMANLIDQQDTDSYPTWIQIAVPNKSGYYRSFYGVEDLPYFYRYQHFTVVDQLPVDTSTGDPSGTTCIGKAQSGTATGTVTTAGDCTYLMAADVWNPHDPNGALTSTVNRPTQFRLSATTDDPLTVTNPSQTAVTSPWSLGLSDGSQPSLIKSTPTALSVANTAMTFTDANGTLFREPTSLWKPSLPAGSNLTAPYGTVTEANTTRQYCGIIGGKVPAEVNSGVNLIYQAIQLNPNNNSVPSGSWQQITFKLEYMDSFGNWIPYDVKYPDLHGLYSPYAIVNPTDYSNGKYQDPLATGQIGDHASGFDPRSARFGIGTESSLGEVSSGTAGNSTAGSPAYVLEPAANSNFTANTLTGYTAIGGSGFTVLETQRPRADKCNQTNYSNPCMTTNPGKNAQMRWFSGTGFSASNGSTTSPLEFDGLLSQNDPSVTFTARDNATTAHMYFEDADGVNRRAMGAYVNQIAGVTPLTDTTTSSLYVVGDTSRVGLPEATASSYASNNGIGSATVQGQSRPIILNRPFRSVSDMSYAFRGTPWENINFFTPESGDTALLDTFCINPPPSSAIVAGKVDLNTRQTPVLMALLSGGYRDELYAYPTGTPPSYALPPITPTEAGLIAGKLTGITSDMKDAWRGPLANLGDLVGRYIPSPGSTGSATDLQTFTEPVTSKSYTYAGLSAALDSSVYTSAMPSGVLAPVPYTIQRFREAGLRPLIDAGQVRTWNLLIDVIAQTGRYPKTATGLDQFVVTGQTRLWVHVAIDRYTGQVIDKQIEVVTP